ncbi:hypothetical protein OAO87_03105 [bacterium]|nr:hypothetical protein [bacterium]
MAAVAGRQQRVAERVVGEVASHLHLGEQRRLAAAARLLLVRLPERLDDAFDGDEQPKVRVVRHRLHLGPSRSARTSQEHRAQPLQEVFGQLGLCWRLRTCQPLSIIRRGPIAGRARRLVHITLAKLSLLVADFRPDAPRVHRGLHVVANRGGARGHRQWMCRRALRVRRCGGRALPFGRADIVEIKVRILDPVRMWMLTLEHGTMKE